MASVAKAKNENTTICCIYRDIDPHICPELSVFAHEGDIFATSYLVTDPWRKSRQLQLVFLDSSFFPLHFGCKKAKKIKDCGCKSCANITERIGIYEVPRLLFMQETKFDEKYLRVKKCNERCKAVAKCAGCETVFQLEYIIFEKKKTWESQRYFLTWEGDETQKIFKK